MRAAEWDRPESVAPLIAAGARLEMKDKHGRTALFTAVEPGHVRVVKAALAAGADLAAKDPNGQTPLTTALGAMMGFEACSLATAEPLASATDEGAVRDAVRRRMERQQVDLLEERNATVTSVNEVVSRMQRIGIDALAEDERGELKRILESAQTVDAEVAALQETGKQLLERTEHDPRGEIPGVFEYGRRHKSITFEAGFLRMSATTFVHRL